MWGRVLNFDSLSCSISTEGISFTTRPTLSAPIFASWSSMSCLSLLVIAFLNYSFVQVVLHHPLPELQERVVHMQLLWCSVRPLHTSLTITSQPIASNSEVLHFCYYVFFWLLLTLFRSSYLWWSFSWRGSGVYIFRCRFCQNLYLATLWTGPPGPSLWFCGVRWLYTQHIWRGTSWRTKRSIDKSSLRHIASPPW